MAIQDRNLAVGTTLWAKYKGETHTGLVVEQEGETRYELEDHRVFKTPSGAGAAIRGGKSTNGWDFWTVGDPPEAKPKETVEKPKRARRGRTVSRDGNGHVIPMVEQVDGTFECANCSASFPTREEAAAHIAEAHPA
jgi:hypothetical protein